MTHPKDPRPASTGAEITAFLYDADGRDREIRLDAQTLAAVHARAILWVDLAQREAGTIERVGEILTLQPATIRALLAPREAVRVDNFGRYLQFAVLLPPEGDEAAEVAARGPLARIDFLVGPNWIVTVHGGEVPYLRAFHGQDKGDTQIGALSAAALASSLLDWHLETYFAQGRASSRRSTSLRTASWWNPPKKTSSPTSWRCDGAFRGCGVASSSSVGCSTA